MQTLSAEPAAPPAPTDADRARDRMNRIAPPASELDRRGRERDAPPPRRRRHGTGKREGFRLGWGGWAAVHATIIVLVVGAVLVWPPAGVCRDQEAKMGFYAGDTLGKCIRRGVAARIDSFDQRLKMAVRGSGR